MLSQGIGLHNEEEDTLVSGHVICQYSLQSNISAADCEWHVSEKFFSGREAITAFLKAKWEEELDYRLVKELW